MLLIPKHQPLIGGLNSYYLNVRKFFEHHQRDLGTFGIHMKSPLMEGIAYFDSGQLISAICLTTSGAVFGEDATERLMLAAEKSNFSVSVYQVDPEMIFFWANALHAKPLHRDLTTDITDLDRLITKMVNQQLTGFIEVIILDGSRSGILFFNSGKIISASMSPVNIGESIELVCSRLLEETKVSGGTFHVSTIPHHTKSEDNPTKRAEPAAEHADPIPAPLPPVSTKTFDPLPMLEDILGLSESVCIENKRVKDFPTQFRKAAMELADKYSFLDPFLKEFEFSNGKLRLEGKVQPQALVMGVLECIQKTLAPLGLTSQFKEKADGWFRVNEKNLKRIGVK